MIKTGITSGLTSASRSGLLLPVHKIIPSQLPDLKLWCRYGQGITETGLGVSQWDDVSGNGNHSKQATDLDRPQKQADGSILFDGIRQFLKTDVFTLNQPTTIYLLAKQVTWTNTDRIFDGNAINTGLVLQTGTTPNLAAYAGSFSGQSSDLAVDTYSIITVVFNGASSVLQIDDNTPITGDFGAANMGGFTLGANGSNLQFGNIQVKEAIGYSAAHDAAKRAKVRAFLQSI